jgi:hypothetical protein
MAYIGASPSNGIRRKYKYTATAAQTSFTNDDNGITVSYVDSLYVDVFQNGVKLAQEDYTSTTGTSVVLVQAASADDIIEIIVFDVFGVADTVSQSAGGNFAGTVGFGAGIASPVTINGATPTLTIGDAGAEDAKIVFDGNAQDFHIGLDDSTDSLTIGLGSALGTTSHMVIDATGAVTMPLQPAFCVTPSSQQDNITADNSSQTIAFGSERFDQNSDFASNTFTAPVTGKYLLSMQLRFENGDTASGYHLWSIATSNKTYQGIRTISGLSADPAYLDFGLTVVADMDANDTAIVQVLIESGAAQSDIDPDSYFSGYLVA